LDIKNNYLKKKINDQKILIEQIKESILTNTIKTYINNNNKINFNLFIKIDNNSINSLKKIYNKLNIENYNLKLNLQEYKKLLIEIQTSILKICKKPL